MKNILESDQDNLSLIRLALQLQLAIDQLSKKTGKG